MAVRARITIPRPKLRDPNVVPARQRKAGPHKDLRPAKLDKVLASEKELELLDAAYPDVQYWGNHE